MQVFLRIIAIVSAVLVLSGQSYDMQDLGEAFGQDVLIIETAENGCFRFNVYLAVSREQQRRGLMFVRDLPPWSGMIFSYERPAFLSMWMKNTYIPLDILFARADGGVSSVQADTEPLSLKPIAAIEPVSYVLELNAGTTARLGIGEGSRLVLDQPD